MLKSHNIDSIYFNYHFLIETIRKNQINLPFHGSEITKSFRKRCLGHKYLRSSTHLWRKGIGNHKHFFLLTIQCRLANKMQLTVQ